MSAKEHYELGLKLESQAKYSEALDNFTEAITLDAQNGLFYVGRASALFYNGDVQSALEDLDRAIQLDVRLTKAYELKSSIKRQVGDLAGAIDDLTKAIHIEPNNALFYLYRGHINKDLNRTLDMIDDYYNAISLNAGLDRLIWASFSFPKKLATIDRIISEFPDHPESYALRSHLRLFQSANYDGGMADLSYAIQLRPDDARFLMLRSIISIGQQDWTVAMSDLNDAIRINPKFVPPYIWRSSVWRALGDTQNAIADLEQAVRIYPNLDSVYIERLQALKQLHIAEEKESTPVGIIKPNQQPDFENQLPHHIIELVKQIWSKILKHPTHQFLPSDRQFLYQALDAIAGEQVEGWLAVIAAQQVLHIFQNVLPDEHLPEALIDMAQKLLTGQIKRELMQKQLNEAYIIAGNLWGSSIDEEKFPANAMLAGYAANSAASEALGHKPLTRLDQFARFKSQSQQKSSLTRGLDWTDLQLATNGQGDTAACAAIAASCNQKGECDPAFLLAFWNWWLTIALPQAWNFTLKSKLK